MSIDRFPVGQQMDVAYPPFTASLTLESVNRMTFEIKEGPYAKVETVDIEVVPLGNALFAVSWQEADGATVTNVQDYDRGVIHSFITLADGQFFSPDRPDHDHAAGGPACRRPAGTQ